MAKRKRPSRAKYSTRFRNAVKRLRSALATLKRKKIIPKETVVRTATPTPGLRRLIRKHKDVVEKQATSYRVGPEIEARVIKDLKSLGYRVVGKGDERRIIVPASQYVRGGKVYEKPTVSRPGVRVKREPITVGNIDERVERAFQRLKPGDLIAFEIENEDGKGGRSHHLYASPEQMIADLHKYLERGFKFTHLTIFKVTKAKQPEYIRDSRQRTLKYTPGTPESRAFYRQRYANRKARRKGRSRPRVSRGH